MSRTWNWFGWDVTGWGILQIVLFIILLIIGVMGCDYQENRLVREQAVTFEQEIVFRQRKEIELENKIKKQQEEINSLRKQLECREDKKQ
tara:strand:+ start:124 stop:393 length:270 start_codon:yes stop_codon:yes gene_type:complete